jgi:RND family efflux transporter MFP subunit
MRFPKKAAALTAGVVLALAVAALAPSRSRAAQNPKADSEVLVLESESNIARLDWIEKSNVAALRDGVIDKMELQNGMPVAKGKPIGYLHDELARLNVAKAQVAVDSVGPKAKAQAQKDLAAAVVAINERLNSRIKGSVSYEEQEKARAELKVAHAMFIEAEEKIKLDKAELNLAKQALEEHRIVAPFDGIVIERLKNPGESVRQNDAVVRLGNLGKLRAFAHVPLEHAYRVKEGQLVDFQPRLAGERQNPLPIEQKRFRGKISFVDPEIQPVAETAVRVYAEFENKDFELRPGLNGVLTIYLNSGEKNADAQVRATSP